MKTSHIIIALLLTASLIPLASRWLHHDAAADAPTTHVITRGPLTVRTSYEGEIESRRSVPVSSSLNNSATIMELISEGTIAAPGDALVRFDPASMEENVIMLERDATLAQAQLDELREVGQPLELDGLTLKRDEAAALAEQALQLVEDTRALRAEDLVSEQELTQQEREAARLTRQREALDRQLAWTRDRLQPFALARARTEHNAAARTLARVRKQIADSTVAATTSGLVVYLPMHVGGEFRTVRVGDTVYRNQPFMLVADMSNLVVNSYVPESEMSQVRAGLKAEIVPIAFPDQRFPATVDSIGTMAHTINGRPVWQKFLRVTLRLDASSDILRSGMTVRVELISYDRDQALLIPRNAIHWSADKPTCRVDTKGGPRDVPLTLGQADDTHCEVLAGLAPGDKVLLP